MGRRCSETKLCRTPRPVTGPRSGGHLCHGNSVTPKEKGNDAPDPNAATMEDRLGRQENLAIDLNSQMSLHMT